MYTFGKSSTEKLLTCRNELQVVAHEAIKLVDFSIIHGYRTQAQQDLIYAQGLSKAKYPNSKHNTNPSDAFDFMPYPVDWKDTKQFSYIAGIIGRYRDWETDRKSTRLYSSHRSLSRMPSSA